MGKLLTYLNTFIPKVIVITILRPKTCYWALAAPKRMMSIWWTLAWRQNIKKMASILKTNLMLEKPMMALLNILQEMLIKVPMQEEVTWKFWVTIWCIGCPVSYPGWAYYKNNLKLNSRK